MNRFPIYPGYPETHFRRDRGGSTLRGVEALRKKMRARDSKQLSAAEFERMLDEGAAQPTAKMGRDVVT